MPADDLVQPHELGQSVVGGHHVAVDQRQGHELHLVVGLGLLVGELDLAAREHLVRQVQALILGHAEGEAVELLLQLVQVPVADDLLERVGGHLAFDKDRVPRLEGVVAVVVETRRRQELALAVQVQRALGDRGPCGDALVDRLLAHLDDVFGALGVGGLDGGALIDGHIGVGHPQEGPGKGHALLGAERFDVHDQDTQGVHRLEHGLHLGLLSLAWRWRPAGHRVGDVGRHVLWDLPRVPVTIDALGGHHQHGVDLALVVEHCRVVDQHEALACAHVGQQSNVRVLPETLQKCGLMQEGLVLERVPLQKIIHDSLPFLKKGVDNHPEM